MTRSLLMVLLLLLASTACDPADPAAFERHLEQLCDQPQVREEYLDFYWDDLRAHQPELWAQALATCSDSCPEAVNCGPVLSVASWYELPVAAAQP